MMSTVTSTVLLAVLFVLFQLFRSSQPFPESGGRTKAIHSEEEWQAAKASGRPFMLDCYATWCPPCRAAAPVYGELSTQSQYAHIDFYKVDVDKCRSVAAECGISAMPTFKLFKKGGVELGEVRGFNRSAIEDLLDKQK
ncbi:thioredoxin-like protein [Pavlovales sp. CCMP2436]|nr:thioredoxin-like protein [Pavlovales sp. CCMP2436]